MITGRAFRFRRFISPAIIFTLLLLAGLPVSADAQDGIDKLAAKLDSVRALAKECVDSDCPDADRAAVQNLLNDLEDAQLFARLSAFWITQLPQYKNSTQLRQKVVRLRSLHDSIRNLIFKASDRDSLMNCVVRLNEARGEDLSKALIDFNRNTGKEMMPSWVWESVQMTGNSLDLDSTDVPERAGEAVKELEPLIGKKLESMSIPEIESAEAKIDPGSKPYEPGAQITVHYELPACVRLPKFVLIAEGDASDGKLRNPSIISSRDTSESSGTVYLAAPQRGGTYEVRVFDRYTQSLLKASAKVTIQSFRATAFPGVYRITRSDISSEIGSHIAIVTDPSGNHYWGSVFQNPVSNEWQFSERRFADEPSRQKLVSKGTVEGTNLKIFRLDASCKGSATEIPVLSDMYLQAEGKLLISQHQAWDCSAGKPVVDKEEWVFDFQAERVSGEPPKFPGSGRSRIAGTENR